MFANTLDRCLSACTDHSACKYLHGSSSERIVEKVRLYELICCQKKITAAGYVFAQNRPFCTRGSFFVEIGLFFAYEQYSKNLLVVITAEMGVSEQKSKNERKIFAANGSVESSSSRMQIDAVCEEFAAKISSPLLDSRRDLGFAA